MGFLAWPYQLLFIQLFLFYSHASARLCSYHQSSALLQFKQLFSFKSYSCGYCYDDLSYPKMMSWKENYDCCSWDGVTCDLVTGHVIGLDLSCSCLSGKIPSNISLSLLPHLRILNLAYNDFNLSQISSDFGRLTSLTHLNLSTSNFGGQIPSEISHLSKLVSLDLSRNYCSLGNCLRIERVVLERLIQNLTVLKDLALDVVDMSTIIPSSLTNLSSSLTSLSLGWCQMQGKVSERIFRLPNLKILQLNDNFNLTGNFPKVNWNSSLKILDVSCMSLLEQLPNSIGNLFSLRVLSLDTCTLVGSVPASLGNLTQLDFLSLSNNKFSGHTPSCLSNLANLHLLDLSNNTFIGEFPDIFSNMTQLYYIYLSRNQLTGPIPSHVNGLQNLVTFQLSRNNLNGTIPSWLCTLPSLKELDLSDNQLVGHIDQFQRSSLQFIYLDDNKLNGSIPSSIFELVNLTILTLSSNNLSGIVELHLFSKLKNLWYLHLSHNSLSINTTFKANSSFPQLRQLLLSGCNLSEFPSMLRNANQLVDLNLSNNKISGQISNWMWDIGKDTLTSLDLSHNNLIGIDQLPWKNLLYLDLRFNLLRGPIPIPPPYSIFLFLSNNKLTGEIPHMICNISAIAILDLSNNSLSGKIPTCMGSFRNLRVLDLRKNRLYGTIPATFVKGNLLRTLNFNGNRLEGPIPRSLVNCTMLQVLDIGDNKVNDTFPYWLESLPELQVLILRSNQLYGSVWGCLQTKHCFPKLKVFDLSNNKFGDPLPVWYFENLNAMKDVREAKRKLQYMGESYYQDSIMVTMKGLQFELVKIITTFTAIDFSNNSFHGEIPEVIGELHSLLHLNLSLNKLTGCIPPSLGNSNALESLDLSSNKLVGEIPNQLASLSFLSVLNLSYNRLVGSIPQGNQFNTFQKDSYIGNFGLCGLPLSKKCGNDEPPSPIPSIYHEGDDDSSWFDWKTALMGYGCGLVIGLSMRYIIFATRKPLWFVIMVERMRLRIVTRVKSTHPRRRN